jgi:glycine/D-amino acid oxidase-like deaminating enzyme/nitrite reductase/ring-hydroxylating ferredoxin subunit
MLDQSLWRSRDLPRFGSRPIPNRVDVVIIGAGITGLTAAWLLKQSGKTVAVFERERIGAGETGNTSAHLTYVTDTRVTELAKRFGRDAARLVWNGGATAIDVIEQNATTPGMTCGFRRVPGFLCAPFARDEDLDADVTALKDDAQLAKELDFAARYVDSGPVTGRPAIAFSDQALFHPLEYLTGLALAVDGGGSHVFEMTEVGQVLQDPLAVVVNGENVACDDVIIATHVPIVGSTSLVSATLFQTKLYPYSTYVLGARVGDDAPAAGLYSDTTEPYFYLRIHEDRHGRYAIFGGEDHKTGQEADTESPFTRLEQQFRTLLPSARIERRWSGQVIETDDGLPFIGQTADHQYVATGYGGNGLTFGTLAGLMMRDAVLGRPNPWRELLDPHRKASSLGAIVNIIKQGVDYPVHYISDRIGGDANDGVESVPRGGGKVLTLDGQRVACHRTGTGKVIKVSAVCTHMGCLVRWNNAEATWDCPCHGSRFTAEGLVIGGPAESPLEKVDD